MTTNTVSSCVEEAYHVPKTAILSIPTHSLISFFYNVSWRRSERHVLLRTYQSAGNKSHNFCPVIYFCIQLPFEWRNFSLIYEYEYKHVVWQHVHLGKNNGSPFPSRFYDLTMRWRFVSLDMIVHSSRVGFKFIISMAHLHQWACLTWQVIIIMYRDHS